MRTGAQQSHFRNFILYKLCGCYLISFRVCIMFVLYRAYNLQQTNVIGLVPVMPLQFSVNWVYIINITYCYQKMIVLTFLDSE